MEPIPDSALRHGQVLSLSYSFSPCEKRFAQSVNDPGLGPAENVHNAHFQMLEEPW